MTDSAAAPSHESSISAVRRRSAAHVVLDDVGREGAAELFLDDDVEHHLRRVLRLRDGEVVTITDLAGHWRSATVVADTRSAAIDGTRTRRSSNRRPDRC